jgi:hypothetical protein
LGGGYRHFWVSFGALSMFLQKLIAVTTIVGISNLPLLASATGVLIRTTCLHPTQGEGVCEIEVPDPANTYIWDVTWQDGIKTRIQLPDRTDRNSTPIQLWNSQNNQWVNSSSTGFCMDRRCIYFSSALANSLEQETSKITIECSDPTLGESMCQAEYMPATKGLRVYWSDGSIEHYRTDNNPFLKWSYAKNSWVKVSNWGICFDKSCVLFDSDAFPRS